MVMGKIYLRILLAIVILVGIAAVVGLFLPRDYSVRVTQTIDAPLDLVFAEVNTTGKWTGWSPWSPDRLDGMTVNYSGPDSGEGATFEWEDPRPDNRFDGRLQITKSVGNERIEYTAMLGQIPMDGFFEFKDVDGKTEVSWIAAGDLPSGSAYGLLTLYYEGFLETELQSSLVRIQESLSNPPTEKNEAPLNAIGGDGNEE